MTTDGLVKLVLILLVLPLSITAIAQEKLSWSDLGEAEKTVLQQLELQWDSIPSERQERLRRGASRWLRMRPEERQSAQIIQQRFQNLTPEQQQLINQRFRQFNRFDRQRQQQLRNLQRRFRQLPEEERQRLRQRFESQARQRAAQPQAGTSQDQRPRANTDDSSPRQNRAIRQLPGTDAPGRAPPPTRQPRVSPQR